MDKTLLLTQLIKNGDLQKKESVDDLTWTEAISDIAGDDIFPINDIVMNPNESYEPNQDRVSSEFMYISWPNIASLYLNKKDYLSIVVESDSYLTLSGVVIQDIYDNLIRCEYTSEKILNSGNYYIVISIKITDNSMGIPVDILVYQEDSRE